MHNSKNGSSDMMKVGVIGAAIAGAAAAYFFLGPKGKKHQKEAKAWAIKMKADVIEKLEMAKEVSEPVYHEIVEAVADEYKKAMKADHAEIHELAEDLKKQWKMLSKSAQTVKDKAVKSAKKAVKKAKL